MKIIEELQSIGNVWDIPIEAMVVSYAPREGLCVWWIKSSLSKGYKYPEFVIEALEFSKGWWIRSAFDDMDWGCSFLANEDDVDMGPFNFRLPAKQFLDFYRVLWASEYDPSETTVNVVNVDYKYLASDQVNVGQKYVPQTQWQQPAPTFNNFMLGQDIVDLNRASDRDINKYLAYNKIRHMMFDGFFIYDDTQMEIIKRLINNKADFIRLLGNL